MTEIHKSWYPIVNLLYQKPLKTLTEEILPNISYRPKKENIFNVFKMPVQDIKVVIIGKDPNYSKNNAIGYSFAIPESAIISPNLRNIKKEVLNTVGIENYNKHWKTLEHWREQGIFLLNTSLTVQANKAGSHIGYWKDFTRRVISFLSKENPCIWVLWGNNSKKFRPYIKHNPFIVNHDMDTIDEIPNNSDWNYILQASNPFLKDFLGCNHFIYINKILNKTKSEQIKF